MQNFFGFFRSSSKPALWLAVAALLLLTVKVVVLNRFPAAAPAILDFGILIEAVLASVVASYIFYLIVVHLKEYQDRKTVEPFIVSQIQGVTSTCERQLAAISDIAKVPLQIETADITSVNAAFQLLHPQHPSPLVVNYPGNNATWMQYLYLHYNHTKEHIARLMTQLRFLSPSEVSLLTQIDQCTHFSYIAIVVNTPTVNTNLLAYAPTFLDYVVLCRNLKEYVKTL